MWKLKSRFNNLLKMAYLVAVDRDLSPGITSLVLLITMLY